jgi:chromosome segregation ATPase
MNELRRSLTTAAATLRAGMVALVLVSLSGSGFTQDTRASREREALRRSQAALQQTQAERDALRGEKDAALKEKDATRAASQALESSLTAARRELAALRGDVQQQRTERGAERARLEQALAAAEARSAESEQAWARQMTELRREREELAKLNANLAAMLERHTEALADARRRNAALHRLGLEAVERYRNKSSLDMALHGERLFGVSEVRIEGVAEELRMQIDAQRAAGH